MTQDIPIPQGISLVGKPCMGVVSNFSMAVAVQQAQGCVVPGATVAHTEPTAIAALMRADCNLNSGSRSR